LCATEYDKVLANMTPKLYVGASPSFAHLSKCNIAAVQGVELSLARNPLSRNATNNLKA
jgi:hypothetical protein